MTELMPMLDSVVFEQLPDRRFVAQSGIPAWCGEVRPGVQWGAPLVLEEVFPFLSVFLPEAEQAWSSDEPLRVVSDFWAELDRVYLRASAVRVRQSRALVILRSDHDFHEKQALLQRARELRMVHSALMKEIEQKDILVHAIVHDLAAPLHSIMGVLSLLEEQEHDPRETSWLRLAIQAASRQRELIGEILDVFSAEGGALAEGAAGGVELYGVIDQVVAEREPVSRARNLSIQKGPPGPATQVVGDPVRLFRVLTNLIDNAIRSSPTGGVVRISTRHEDGAVLVFVEDDGPGVRPELLPRLFEKFARGRESKVGTGLGLFFCRITVENWGGGVGYERRETGGARFWVRLKTMSPVREQQPTEASGDHGESTHARR